MRGEIEPGEALPSEAEMMRSFQVSRETLREALGVLESETLVVIRRGRHGGAVVRRPDIDVASRHASLLLQIRGATAGEVMEARHVMVRPALAMLAEFPAPDAVERLQAICRREAAAIDDPLGLAEQVRSFEHTAAQLTGMKTLATLVGVLDDVYGSVLHRLLGAGDGAPSFSAQVVAHHARFVERLRVGDVRGCEETWSRFAADSRAALSAGGGRDQLVDVVPTWLDAARRRPGRVSSRVLITMRARIARGELLAGSRLAALPELEREFGVSRPTLREALRILETEGLLALRAGSRAGATILHPTEDMTATLAGIVLESEEATLADLWQSRVAFEPAVMGLSAERISPPEVLEFRLRQADWSWMAIDTKAWIAELLETRFRALDACGNTVLALILSIVRRLAGLSTVALQSTSVYSSWEVQRNRDRAREYDALIDALEAGDGPRAAKVWDTYLRAEMPYFHARLGGRLLVDLVDY